MHTLTLPFHLQQFNKSFPSLGILSAQKDWQETHLSLLQTHWQRGEHSCTKDKNPCFAANAKTSSKTMKCIDSGIKRQINGFSGGPGAHPVTQAAVGQQVCRANLFAAGAGCAAGVHCVQRWPADPRCCATVSPDSAAPAAGPQAETRQPQTQVCAWVTSQAGDGAGAAGSRQTSNLWEAEPVTSDQVIGLPDSPLNPLLLTGFCCSSL